MAHTKRRRRLLMTGLALAILAGGSGLSIAHQIAKANDRAQPGADSAALAALNAMIGTDGQLDGSRTQAATEAASRVAAGHGATMLSIRPSPESRSLSVVVVANQRQHEIATAHYVPPGEALRHNRLAALAQQQQ